MNHYLEQIDAITRDLNKDRKNFLYLDVLKRLINILDEKKLNEIQGDLDKLMVLLKIVTVNYNRQTRKEYNQQYQSIKSFLRSKYGYVQKGSFFGIYLAIFLPLGAAFGVALKQIGLGLSLGLLLTAVFSMFFERDAEKKGLSY
ncbi:MAG TPA: hypothetical protein P5107_07035 [Thermotogota bacterium]|nr:hypothetical protein [Thermotogota bacterium]HRW34792.1 hypothetical protein [Thermotogota bacterium]